MQTTWRDYLYLTSIALLRGFDSIMIITFITLSIVLSNHHQWALNDGCWMMIIGIIITELSFFHLKTKLNQKLNYHANPNHLSWFYKELNDPWPISPHIIMDEGALIFIFWASIKFANLPNASLQVTTNCYLITIWISLTFLGILLLQINYYFQIKSN